MSAFNDASAWWQGLTPIDLVAPPQPVEREQSPLDEVYELIKVYGITLALVKQDGGWAMEVEIMLDAEFSRIQLWEYAP